jgi:aldehyde:ferredoxin oxidoreductase
VRALVIGPAGERLIRIATIQATSSSAAGQGGFGGVMGSKKLKAISVMGTGQVSLANAERITQLSRALARAVHRGPPRGLEVLGQQLATEGHGSARCEICTEACLTPCQPYLQAVPGVVHGRRWSGAWVCAAWVAFPGFGKGAPAPIRAIYDWHLERRAAFEMNVLSNRYGLNQIDLLVGMVPWLIACQKAGLISEMNGRAMDWWSPHFWDEFLRATAYREGMGDVLAEGGWAAAKALQLGEELARLRYPGWGHAAHWDGHDLGYVPFPFWLVSALQWLSDTRDPFNSGHGYVRWPADVVAAVSSAETDADRAAVLQRARAVAETVYGEADALDPHSGYRGKARPGHFHTVRPVIKDCVPVDDQTFPLTHNDEAPDGLCVLYDIEGIGDIPGPSAEYHLFAAGTGVPWSEEEFSRAAQRVCTLERALQVRHWGRDRGTDEMVLPYFERTEFSVNPLLGERYGLDRKQFGSVIDEFYRLHGWDPATAWPTSERLRELDLGDVYEPMVEGAERAKASGE